MRANIKRILLSKPTQFPPYFFLVTRTTVQPSRVKMTPYSLSTSISNNEHFIFVLGDPNWPELPRLKGTHCEAVQSPSETLAIPAFRLNCHCYFFRGSISSEASLAPDWKKKRGLQNFPSFSPGASFPSSRWNGSSYERRKLLAWCSS